LTFQELDRETPRLNEFTISLQPTGKVEIDLGALASYCQGGSSVDIPLRPIQAVEWAVGVGSIGLKMAYNSRLNAPVMKGTNFCDWVSINNSKQLRWLARSIEKELMLHTIRSFIGNRHSNYSKRRQNK